MQDKDNENDEECNSALLPQISEGEIGSYNDIHMLEKNNKATAKFTEATLLKTMNENLSLRQRFRNQENSHETDGIGTQIIQS